MQQRAEAEEAKAARRGGARGRRLGVECNVFLSVFALYALTTAPSVAEWFPAGGDRRAVRCRSIPGIPPVHSLYHIPLTYMPACLSPAMWANYLPQCWVLQHQSVVCADHEGIVTVRRPVRPVDHWRISGLPLRFSPLVWQYHCTSEVLR